MDVQSNCLFITYVEKEGPFLKVWGQTDKNTSLYVEQVLHSFTNQFDNGLCIPHPESLQIGILCCAKYKDNKYYRARITSLDFLHNRYIELNFVDYGHKDVVPISNIRSLEGFETGFISIPAQASSFLLAEAVCPRGEWNDQYLEEISKDIRYSEVNYGIIAQVTKHYLVRLFVGVNDLAIILISKGLMRHTSLTTQEAVLLSMMPRAPMPQQAAATQQNIATYKAFSLEPGNQYEVYVSYVTDGPCNFSIQLKQSEEVLAKLMKEINSMTLTPIEGIPLPGTVCLARCMDDAHICRAVVTNEVDGQFKVFYVDFGNFEVVSLESLYEIPFKFVIPKVMAIRFALAGIEKSTVTLDMQCAFKQFVDNRLIHMKVMPMTTRTSLPRCELWDPESQISVLDIVNQAAAAGYPDHISLNRGFTQPVKVSYVFSCNRFYVQLKSREEELTRLMLDIQILCRDAEHLPSMKKGSPCYALYEGDQQWYRSQIVEILDDNKVRVQYVDFGNEEVVDVSFLKVIEGKQLTILRPQAIECCLNGYQNMEPDLERDNLLEELILEQEFTMKVVEMQGKKALIELIDSANYNVASLLLDKIAVTRSQVSPMLVQAGNKIEHRKSQQYGSREQRKPDRFTKWTDATNDNGGWRQDDNGPRNRNNFDSNETNENNSWRQNNKSRNFDRNKRDELNDSTDSEKHSQKSFGKSDRNRNEYNNRNADGGSWKQNKFNKNNDRFNSKEGDEWGNGDDRKIKDDNEWGEPNEKKFSKDRNEWGGHRENDRRPPRERKEWGGNRDRNQTGGDSWGGESKGDDWKNSNTNERRGGDKEWDDNRGGRKNFGSRSKNEWGGDQDEDSRQSNRKEKSWGGSEGNQEGGWGNRDGNKGRDFKPPRKRFEEGGGNEGWNDDSNKGGYKKRPEFKREASELSSSGSEKSFRKGFKDNKFRDKPNFNKKFDRPNKFGGHSSGGGDGWDSTSKSNSEVPNPAPSTAKFSAQSLENTEANVTISWFHNPSSFYCQIESTQDEFKRLMADIQLAYKGRTPSTATVGAPIVGFFPEDKVLYRAEVLETIGSKFKVYYVDFGNVSVIEKVWPIETRFMELPAQAIRCKLSGVEPLAEHWLDAANYTAYFDKKQFLCRFISPEDDKMTVQLECEGEDIGSSLVRDGLAKGSLSVVPPELPLLIGQQFRAMLITVNSLADFSVSLQSGVLLNCSVFNLSQSTETWESNLQDKIDQILIIYVDHLEEERLQVTLYDANGQKIKLIDKDEEAFESVELLCPYLITQSFLSGEITHVEENTVYVQPSDSGPTLEFLINACYEEYENSPVESPVTPVENFVYAVRGSDTNWYRARVTKIEDDKITVNYLDYGNSEEVESNAVRDLTAEFMELPILCVPVTIPDATEELIGKFVTVNLTFGETGLEGTIQEEQQPPVPIEEECQVSSSIQEEYQVSSSVQEEQLAVPLEEAVTTQPPDSIGTQVVLSHADSPSDFYLQLAESLDTIEQLQANLQEQIVDMPDIETPTIGVLCAAPYSVDQQWYRAKVLDADTDITTVRFVDYGNTDVLNNQTTHIKTLPPELLSLEVHATRCGLKIKSVDEEWSGTASERFDELCNAESLTVVFISQDEKTNYVELYSNGTNIREVLIQENLALPDEVLVDPSSVGFVSHLNSPSEFWIQLENCVEELEWVAEQLSGAETFPELEDLSPGTLCAALFPDDQMWYRARILSNTVAGLELLFVDYGNSCTSCSLRELPEDLAMMAPLAQKCSLQKPENLTAWGPEMVRKFGEISADGQTTFQVKKLSTGETAVVELLLDGVDVTTLLLPHTEDVRVKSLDGLEQLVLVKGEDELPERYKLEGLPDVTWNEESIRKFEEVVDNGNTVLQAEFVSEDTVRLYIGLNDIRLDLNGTKASTPTSSPLKVRSAIPSDITHSDATGDETFACLVESVSNETFAGVENGVDTNLGELESSEHRENEKFMEGLVMSVVDSIGTNQEESMSDGHETAECFDTELTDHEHSTNKTEQTGLDSSDISFADHEHGTNKSCSRDSSVERAVSSIVDELVEQSTLESPEVVCDNDSVATDGIEAVIVEETMPAVGNQGIETVTVEETMPAVGNQGIETVTVEETMPAVGNQGIETVKVEETMPAVGNQGIETVTVKEIMPAVGHQSIETVTVEETITDSPTTATDDKVTNITDNPTQSCDSTGDLKKSMSPSDKKFSNNEESNNENANGVRTDKDEEVEVKAEDKEEAVQTKQQETEEKKCT